MVAYFKNASGFVVEFIFIVLAFVDFFFKEVSCGPEPCFEGTYGKNCKLRCHCDWLSTKETSCDKESGKCPGKCEDGWVGAACNETICSTGLWGPECKFYCACAGRTQCTIDSGMCAEWKCLKGWIGNSCDKIQGCPEGRFGPRCDQKCLCGQGVPCDMRGNCPDDVFVQRRPDCETKGKWGYYCNQTCELDGCITCDRDSGLHCHKCEADFTKNGTKCDTGAPDKDTQNTVRTIESALVGAFSAILSWFFAAYGAANAAVGRSTVDIIIGVFCGEAFGFGKKRIVQAMGYGATQEEIDEEGLVEEIIEDPESPVAPQANIQEETSAGIRPLVVVHDEASIATKGSAVDARISQTEETGGSFIIL